MIQRFLLACAGMVAYLGASDFVIKNVLWISMAMFIAMVTDFLYNVGREIRALDIMATLAVASYLFSPALLYHTTESGWYEGYVEMAVTAERYFSVAFPGTMALVMGLSFPFKSTRVNHKELIGKVQEYLADKPDVGVVLYWVGVISIFVMPFAPSAMALVVYYSSLFIYVGGLYVWYSPNEQKVAYLIGMFVVPVIKSLYYVMFTDLIYWSFFLLMILLLKFRVPLWAKAAVVVGGGLFVLTLQSVKYEFRQRSWNKELNVTLSQRVDIFKAIVNDRFAKDEMIFDPTTLISVMDRSNQGYLTSMAIRHVPEYEPYANGETVFLSTLASFVPRFIWADKPVVGGRDSMIRFTGMDPGINTAMDIGQLGDAYVNFGTMGGAVFLFFYGLLYTVIYARLFYLSSTTQPSAFLWIPMFFAGSCQVESSVLSTVNNLLKVAIFFVLAHWAFKKFAKMDL